MTAAEDPDRKPTDTVLLRGATPDGRGREVLRLRDSRLEIGVVRPLEHGRPIHGEVVTLHPRPKQPLMCDVEVHVPAPEKPDSSPPNEPHHKGPPQVATPRYRDNWELIFGRRPREEPIPN